MFSGEPTEGDTVQADQVLAVLEPGELQQERAFYDHSVSGAGAAVQVVAKEGDYVSVKLPSGEIRKVYLDCLATIGQGGNIDHDQVAIGKAGRSRWLGKRPHVRGVAMNPVDHPLGGGEGKTSGGRHPVTPWGVPTKGYKTRGPKPSDKFIVQRRSK